MDAPHPTSAGRFPPSEDTFAGSLMLRVARGDSDLEDLRGLAADLADDLEESFPEEPPMTAEEALAVLDEVVAEHERLVPGPSADAVALLGVLDELPRRGIAVSFGEAFDAAEGAETGYAAARALGSGARGYVYVHTQDLDGLVLGDALYLGYSGMGAGDLEESAAVGRTVHDALSDAGLTVEWDGDPRGRLLIRPIAWARPFRDGPVRVGPSDVEQPRTPSGRSWWQRLTGR